MVNLSRIVGSGEVGEMVLTPPPWKRNPIVSAVEVLASLIASRRVHPPFGLQSPSPGSVVLLTVRVWACAGSAASTRHAAIRAGTSKPSAQSLARFPPSGSSKLGRVAVDVGGRTARGFMLS